MKKVICLALVELLVGVGALGLLVEPVSARIVDNPDEKKVALNSSNSSSGNDENDDNNGNNGSSSNSSGGSGSSSSSSGSSNGSSGNSGGSSGSSGSNGSGSCEHSILGLRPWYSGLPMGANCTLQSPDEDGMAIYVWTIVLNVLSDVFVVAGYLAIGFVVYGGVQYMISAGDPGKVARGKKMLVSAATGLVIALLATVIVNIIISVLAGAAS